MRALITGAAGFVGKHLIRELHEHGTEVIAADINLNEPLEYADESLPLDILDPNKTRETFARFKPDYCVHLAGITFAPSGKSFPVKMFNVNAVGTLNLLEAIGMVSPSTRILTVSTAHVYGNHPTGENKLDEKTSHKPSSMYAISKSAADRASLIFAQETGLLVCVARPNNHTGPGQPDCFVVPAIISQAKKIASGQEIAELHIGNPESKRDFCDVRDVVRAYRMILENGRTKCAYNISSGSQISIGLLVDKICRLSGINPEIIVDQSRFRPTDMSPVLDTTALERDTGWRPEIPLEKTLKDMLSK